MQMQVPKIKTYDSSNKNQDKMVEQIYAYNKKLKSMCIE